MFEVFLCHSPDGQAKQTGGHQAEKDGQHFEGGGLGLELLDQLGFGQFGEEVSGLTRLGRSQFESAIFQEDLADSHEACAHHQHLFCFLDASADLGVMHT